MRIFVAAGITLAFLQITSDVAAEMTAANGTRTHQVPVSGSPVLPSGSIAAAAESSPDSEETPAFIAEADHSFSSSPVDVHSTPSNTTDSHLKTAGAPPAFVAGDMSSGKCMCPPPPSCSAPMHLSHVDTQKNSHCTSGKCNGPIQSKRTRTSRRPLSFCTNADFGWR